jgi:ABC-type glycerol-3-phosphate transport system substrate-binding protein
MPRTRTIRALLLAIVLGIGASTTFAQQSWSLEEAAEPYRGASLTVATVAWQGALAEIAADFSNRTGISVEVVQVPRDQLTEKALLELRSRGTAYDLFAFTRKGPFVEADLLPSLNPFLSDPALADPSWRADDFVMFPTFALANDMETVVGIPFGAAGMALFYRSDLFEDPMHRQAFQDQHGYELAAPDSWTEFADVASYFDGAGLQSFSGGDVVGWAFPGARGDGLSWFFTFMTAGVALEQDGVELRGLVSEAKQPIYEPFSVAALELINELVAYAQPSYLQDNDTAVREVFADGGAAMVITWDSFLGRLNTGNIADNWALAPIPTRGLLGGWSLGLNPFSENAEAAFLLGQFISSYESDLYMFTAAGRYPARLSVYESDTYRTLNPYADELARAKAESVIQVSLELGTAPQVLSHINDIVSMMLSGQLTAEAAADRIQSGIRDILQDEF